MTSILYNDLMTLISASSLVPEEQYRITNYVTYITLEGYSSNDKSFDIIVTAKSTTELYEYATLAKSPYVDYFTEEELSLYNIKYNVHNIIPGYYSDWVYGAGRGVIYYMSDNNGNEAPFDFKNIKYNDKFLFHDLSNNTDASRTIATYNKVGERIEGELFKIPLVQFYSNCDNCEVGKNAVLTVINTCQNIRIGDDNVSNTFINVNNSTFGDVLHSSYFTYVNNSEFGNNNSNITANYADEVIMGYNNDTINIADNCNSLNIDNNNSNITIGIICKELYINQCKDVSIGYASGQFNISNCYDVVIGDECKLFNFVNSNHIISDNGCKSIKLNGNDYVNILNGIKNIEVVEGIDNIILNYNYMTTTEPKIVMYDEYDNLIVLYENGVSYLLMPDGTLLPNPNSFITDSPFDDVVYGRKNGEWVQINTYEKFDEINSTTNIAPVPDIKLYYLNDLSSGNLTVTIDSSNLLELVEEGKFYTFELMIDTPVSNTPDTDKQILFGSNIEVINEDVLYLRQNKRNLFVFRTFSTGNLSTLKWIVNMQGYWTKTSILI